MRLTAEAEREPERLGGIVVEALEHEDSQVRFAAAVGLGRIDYGPAAEKLTPLLDDREKAVRLQAAQTLAKLDRAGLAAVMAALEERSIGNVDEALLVVTRITGRSFGLGNEGRKAALEYWAREQGREP